MRCPRCNTWIETEATGGMVGPGGCTQCGWGASAPDDEPVSEERSKLFWWKFAGFWLLTLAFVFGPYLGARHVVLFVADGNMADDSTEAQFLAALNVHYWWVLAVYIAFSWMVTPNYEMDNLGYHRGGRLGDLSTTPEEQYNRMMHSLADFVLPGKIILRTLAVTWRVMRPPNG